MADPRSIISALNHVRLYFSGSITNHIDFMFNTDYDRQRQINVLDAAGAIQYVSHVSFLGRPLSRAQRSRKYLRSFLLQINWYVYTDGIQDGYNFVFQGRDNGVTYWGDFKAGIVKIKLPPACLTAAPQRRQSQSSVGRPRPTRFLGQGRRLLPERHLLRRQKPAGHRRRDADAGRQDCLHR